MLALRALVIAACVEVLVSCIEPRPKVALCSKGAEYESLEVSCDGVDNDCDGRSDVSRAVRLTTAPVFEWPFWNGFSWTYVSRGFSAAYWGSEPGIRFRRFSPDFTAASDEVDLSRPDSWSWSEPKAFRFGADTIVGWTDMGPLDGGGAFDGGIPTGRVVLSKLDPMGHFLFRDSRADGGVVPSRVLPTPESMPASLEIVPSTDGEYLLVLWTELGGYGLRAVVLSPNGEVVTAPTVLVPALRPDGGPQILLGYDACAVGTQDFAVVSNSFDAEWRTASVTLRRYSPTLTEAPVRWSRGLSGFAWPRLLLDPQSRSGEIDVLIVAWMELNAAGTPVIRIEYPFGDTKATEVVVDEPGTPLGLELLAGRSGPFAVWVQRALDIDDVHPHRILARRPGGATVDLTPYGDPALPDFPYPTVTRMDTGLFALGMRLDGGQPGLYGELFCEP